MNNETQVSIKFKNSVTGQNKLEKYKETLSQISVFLNSIDGNKAKNIDNYASKSNKVSNNVSKTTKESKELSNNLGNAFSVAKIGVFLSSLERGVQTISKYTKKSADFLENWNLLDVAFQNNTAEAEKFVNTLSEMYGLDESWGYRTVGLFKQLSNAMGLSDEVGTKLSKTLTQLAIDTSSLYNIDPNDTVSILQSGLAGQTKPVRRLGGDITQTTLQTTLEIAGIDKAVNELSYAEKRLVIVATLLNQTSEASGDWGRTMNSVANQMRIFQQQTERLTRAIGNVFLPILKMTLPYINAFLMVLTEIISVLAALVGYDKEEFDFFSSGDSVMDFTDAIGGLGDSLDDTNEKSKKLQMGLRGFDKLNNIKTPSSSAGGVGGVGGAGGISGDILGLFNTASDSYLNNLEKVSNKATEIRDKIMDWLGFTKIIDEETGDVSFKFDHITSGTVLGALGIGGFIFLGISKIFKVLKGIGGLKFPIISKVFGSIFGGGSSAKNTTQAANDISKSVKTFTLPNVKTVLLGLADLAIIIGGMGAIVTAIGLLMKIPGYDQVIKDGIEGLSTLFWGLAKVSLPIIEFAVIIGVMGKIGVATFAKGLADIAMIIGGLEGIILVTGAILSIPYTQDFVKTGMETIETVFKGLEKLFLPLIEVSALVGALGAVMTLTGGTGFAAIGLGLLALAAIIDGMALVVASAGLLMEIPGFDEFVTTGGNLIVQMFGILGEMYGTFTEKFTSSMFESLPEMGTNLSDFMINAKPFFEGISDVSSETTESMKNLAACILMLTANDVLEGLTNWFAGDTSLVEFGKELEEFAPYFKNYAEEIANINEDGVKKSVLVMAALANIIDVAQDIPNHGPSVVSFFVGDNKIDEFGKMLESFGKDFMKYVTTITDMTQDDVDKSSLVFAALANIIEVSKDIPNHGPSVVRFFVGDNKLDEFGKMISSFGEDFMIYLRKISGVTKADLDKSWIVFGALDRIIDVSQDIPRTGPSVISFFLGNNTLSKFGKELVAFIKEFLRYYVISQSIGDDVLDKTKSIFNSIAVIDSISKGLGSQNGFVNFVAGTSTLPQFGSALALFGGHFKTYYNNIKGVSTTKVEQVSEALRGLVAHFLKVKNEGLNTTIINFGNALVTASNSISTYFSRTHATNIGNDFGSALGSAIANKIKTTRFPTIKVTGSGGDEIGKFKLSAYAQGGLPPVGQLFVANERGPELVGQIGGQTFVANQNQMMELLDSKLGNSQSNRPQVFNIYLDENNKLGTYTLNQLQEMAKSNGEPITIW